MKGSFFKSGLTIVEILIVVSILLILAGLAGPAFMASKKSALARSCSSNLRQIHLANGLYMADFEDRFPRAKDCIDLQHPGIFPPPVAQTIKGLGLLPQVLEAYAKSRNIFRCPADRGAHVIESLFPVPLELAPSAFDRCGLSFEYHSALGLGSASGTSAQNPALVNLAADLAGHWHGEGSPLLPSHNFDDYLDRIGGYRYNIIYIDGHVRLVNHQELEAAWRRN